MIDVVIAFIIINLGVGLLLYPPPYSNWRDYRDYIKFGFSSCMSSAAFNSLLLWSSYEDWITAWGWLFGRHVLLAVCTALIIAIGSAWAVYLLCKLPWVIRRNYQEFRGSL